MIRLGQKTVLATQQETTYIVTSADKNFLVAGGKCNGFCEFWTFQSNEKDSFSCRIPQQGCTVIIYLLSLDKLPAKFEHGQLRAGDIVDLPKNHYVILTFQDGQWVTPGKIGDVDLISRDECQLRLHGVWFKIAGNCSRNQRGCLTFFTVLDYLGGICSIADIFALDNRLRMLPKVARALNMIRSLKGALGGVKSSTAEKAQLLLEEALQEGHMF